MMIPAQKPLMGTPQTKRMMRLRSASQVAAGSRDPPRQPSEVRSDKAAYDEDERRSSAPSTRAVRKEKQRARKASEVRSEKGDEPGNISPSMARRVLMNPR